MLYLIKYSILGCDIHKYGINKTYYTNTCNMEYYEIVVGSDGRYWIGGKFSGRI